LHRGDGHQRRGDAFDVDQVRAGVNPEPGPVASAMILLSFTMITAVVTTPAASP
jgi:hypothetical protein